MKASAEQKVMEEIRNHACVARIRRCIGVRGVNVNYRDHGSGDAFLHAAVRVDNQSVVGVLLLAGLNPDAKNKSGRTALDIARINGNKPLVKVLEKASVVSSPGRQ
jgi:hypothetical protein